MAGQPQLPPPPTLSPGHELEATLVSRSMLAYHGRAGTQQWSELAWQMGPGGRLRVPRCLPRGVSCGRWAERGGRHMEFKGPLRGVKSANWQLQCGGTS